MDINSFYLITLTFICIFNTASTNHEGKICTQTNGKEGECRRTCPDDSAKYNGVNSCGDYYANRLICCPKNVSPARYDEVDEDEDGAIVFPSEYDTSTVSRPNPPRVPSRTPQRQLTLVNDRKSFNACNELVERISPRVKAHIVGTKAEEKEFPHMAAVGYREGNFVRFKCGGTIISSRYVLTAAHCARDRRDQPAFVRLGESTLTNSPVANSDYNIENITVHPEYNASRKYHGLALLRLNRDVEITKKIHPACLNTNMEDVSTNMTITGWGLFQPNNSSSRGFLRKANVMAVNRMECNSRFLDQRQLPDGITAQLMCARNPISDVCRGDSGGPMQVPHSTVEGLFVLHGVTSFGRGCITSTPGVYVRVAAYLDWIESIVWP